MGNKPIQIMACPSLLTWDTTLARIKLLFSGKTDTVTNRSPKGNTWSAIPVALLSMVVNQNERQGSGPKGGEVL